jgi:hypothetical protein
MALQLSTDVRNAMLNTLEDTIGVSPVLEIRSGAKPANCAAADTGTVLATLTLPADWLQPAANGSKALAGIWEDLAADATGTAGHFRIKQGATCHAQGSYGTSGTDMIGDSVDFTAGQKFSIDEFTVTAGGA